MRVGTTLACRSPRRPRSCWTACATRSGCGTTAGAPRAHTSSGSGQQVSASTQNQALSALLFLYKHVLRIDVGPIEPAARGKMPHRVPVVLSPAEVALVLRQLDGAVALIVSLLYGAGLRLQESLELRVKDLDFDRHEILVLLKANSTDHRLNADQFGCAIELAALDPSSVGTLGGG